MQEEEKLRSPALRIRNKYPSRIRTHEVPWALHVVMTFSTQDFLGSQNGVSHSAEAEGDVKLSPGTCQCPG